MSIFNKVLTFIGLLIFSSINIVAENLEINFTVQDREIMIEPMQRKDLNGEICALVKVKVPIKGCKFEGSIIESYFDVNEYWVFVKAGSKRIDIKLPNQETMVVVFNNYGIEFIKSKTIYELTIRGLGNKDLNSNNIGASKNTSTNNTDFKCIVRSSVDGTRIPNVLITYESKKKENIGVMDVLNGKGRHDTGVRYTNVEGEALFRKIYKGEVLKFVRPGYKEQFITFDSISNNFEIQMSPEEIKPLNELKVIDSPNHLSIGCLSGDTLYVFSCDNWKKLSMPVRQNYDSKWLVINKDGRRFLLSFKMEDKKRWIDHMTSDYKQMMPSSEDMKFIMDNIKDINAALKQYGGKKAMIKTSKKDREIWFGKDEFRGDEYLRTEVGVFLDGYMHIDYDGKVEHPTRLIRHF